jgi:hypothetical protein
MQSLCGGVFSTVVTFLNVVMFDVMFIMYPEAFRMRGQTVKFVNLPWQHWTKTLVWFGDVDISAFHSCTALLLLIHGCLFLSGI